ncbi:MAG: EAL domain-containing protein [Pseudomonadales bacterium]|nr:EAL domain-containing protein [Pseudomonadales bacterium]
MNLSFPRWITSVYWAGIIATASLLLTFYLLYNAAASRELDEISSEINDLKRLNYAINEAILSHSSGDTLHYDHITRATQAFELRINRILDHSLAEADDHLANLWNSFQQSAGVRLQMIETYKSHYSLLHNSSAYFLMIARQARALPVFTTPLEAEKQHQLEELILGIQKLMAFTHTDQVPVENIISALDHNLSSITNRSLISLIQSAVSHARILMRTRNEINEVFDNINGRQTTRLLDQLQSAVIDIQRTQLQQAAEYRQMMAATSLLLLLMIGALVYRQSGLVRQLAASKQILELQNLALDKHAIVSEANVRGEITYVNDQFVNISGYSRDELLGENHRLVNSGAHDRAFFKKLWQTIARGDTWHGEIRNQKKNGDYYWVDASIVPITDSSGRVEKYISIRTDITEEKNNTARKLYKQANFSDVTGLPNRYYAENAIQNLLKNKVRLMAAMLDIADLRRVNSSLGYVEGDQLLRCCAKRLNNIPGDSATFCDLGGGHFLFFAEITEQQDPHQLSADWYEKIAFTMKEPIAVGPANLLIRFHLGFSISTEETKSAALLMSAAHSALSRAKDNRTLSYFIAGDSQSGSQIDSLLLEAALQQAVKSGRLTVNYQPQIDVRTGHVKGMEALVRWKDDKLGWVSPELFINIAEKSDLILDIGRLVLKTAIYQLRDFQLAGMKNVRMSVNLSPRQIYDKGLIAEICMLADSASVDLRDLELELTEGVLIDDSEDVLYQLLKLKDLGISLALDDFGTGYSALSYLQKYSFDILKIDKAFVSGMEDSARKQEMVAAIIAMARAMNMTIIAEGVETEVEAALLARLGCDLYQGYLYARPMPADDLIDWFQGYQQLQPDNDRSFA